MTPHGPQWVIPTGTQVVTEVEIKSTNGRTLFAKGAVGVVVKSPIDNTHAYRVRFMDGTEASLKRDELQLHRHFKNPQAPERTHDDLYQYVIYKCVVGSRAYGLDTDDSDTDRRGFYLPPADVHWSLYGVPEQLESSETEESYWEIQKFITLALKANPNILECLYTPLVEHITPLAQELIDLREIFLSKLIYQTYNGYVASQFKKMQKDIENHGTIRWKHAMHLIRLLRSGIITLQERHIPVGVDDDQRDYLLAIRDEAIPWEDVNAERLRLHKAFDSAFNTTKLPERPDYERANAFLIYARRSMLS